MIQLSTQLLFQKSKLNQNEVSNAQTVKLELKVAMNFSYYLFI